MNYRAWYALAELVDNALDSYLHHERRLRHADGESYRLRIVIEVVSTDGGYIRVWDNAAGINTSNYQRAFVTAEPPTDSAGLSQFGIGMKSASCWFARQWSVRTTALGENIERRIEFDVPKIIRQQDDTLHPTVYPARDADHFTEVRLWNLHKPPQTQTIGKMKRHIASMYRNFLRSGVVQITFNGEDLAFEEPAVLRAPYYRDATGVPVEWRSNVDLTLFSGARVRGFVAIRERGSTKMAGLALFRHRRLVVGSDDEAYRPPEIFGPSNSYAYQRVFGELELDDFAVSHTKDGFIWGEQETEFLSALRTHLDSGPLPLLQQAEKYRARQASSDAASAATRAAGATAAALAGAEHLLEEQIDAVPSTRPPAEDYGSTEVASTRKLQLEVKGVTWNVTIDTTTDPSATDWVKVRELVHESHERQLGILFSVSHPFTQRFGGTTAAEVEGLVRIAVGLAMAETVARESGVRMAGAVMRNLNELLGSHLSRG